MVASVPSGQTGKLARKAGIASAEAGPFSDKSLKKADHHIRFAMQAWNEHVSVPRRMRAMASPRLGKAWGVGKMKAPDPPQKVMNLLRRREARLAPRRAAARRAVAGAPDLTKPVLVGRVAVGLVYVDSTVSEFKITDSQKLKVLAETTEGLNMLSGFEPRANIQWFYDIRRPKLSLAASKFTTANQNKWEDVWRDPAMHAMGYTPNLNGMKSYINYIKKRFKAQWAYVIFVTKYPKYWFAYYWGNHVVMDFQVDGWGIDNFSRVVAHETGHVFCCADEYSASNCTCTSRHGRYQVINGNCEKCASPFIPCLMAHNTTAICDYSRGQLGWNELAVQSRGTTTLKGTWTFDFDTGIQGPPGGADVWWEQVDGTIRLLVPQSGAMLAHMGKPNFDAVSVQTLKSQAFATTPINGSNNVQNKLKPGSVIAIKTGSGRYAKMRINTYGYNLGITWVTYK
jgi:hypothetical protein